VPDPSAPQVAGHNPPVSRRLIVLLAILLLVQVRSDREVRGGESPWGGPRGLALVRQLHEYIRTRVPDPPSDDRLYLGAIRGMLGALDDRYCAYVPPRAMRHLDQALESEPVGGIGVQVRARAGEGLEVFMVFEGMPAAGAGIQEGDLIVSADGVDLTQMSLQSSIELILGPIGSAVELQVRKRDDTVQTVSVPRVELPRVPPCRLLPDADGIAYLSILFFSYGLEDQLAEEIRQMRDRGLRGMVIDLRWSPGGALETGIAVSDLFLARGTIVTVEERDPQGASGKTLRQTCEADAETIGDFPIALLIDEYTASAAELFAAALRDNGRAVLVGGRSYGKGRIQAMLLLREGAGAVNLTIGRYLSPSGADIEGQGLAPDVLVDLEDAELQRLHRVCADVGYGRGQIADLMERDPQFRRAVELLRQTLANPEKP